MNSSLWLDRSAHQTCHFSRRKWLEFNLDVFKFLGAPVGDREFAASFVQDKRAAKADVLLTEIAGIDDAQVTHKLLSRCMGTARVMHAMRTTRPDWMLGQLEHVDKSMAITVETCFGFAMPPSAEVQASLPVSLGGLGFRSAKRHAAVAYLCSRVATRSLCEAMDPSFSWDVAVASGGGISESDWFVQSTFASRLSTGCEHFTCSLRKPARFESQSGRVDESPTFVIWARQRGGASQGAGRWSSPRRSLVDCTPVSKLGAANDSPGVRNGSESASWSGTAHG